MTALTLFMGSMNLNAGMANFGNLRLFANFASHLEVMGTWLATGIIIATLNIIAIIKIKKDNVSPKRNSPQTMEQYTSS